MSDDKPTSGSADGGQRKRRRRRRRKPGEGSPDPRGNGNGNGGGGGGAAAASGSERSGGERRSRRRRRGGPRGGSDERPTQEDRSGGERRSRRRRRGGRDRERDSDSRRQPAAADTPAAPATQPAPGRSKPSTIPPPEQIDAGWDDDADALPPAAAMAASQTSAGDAEETDDRAAALASTNWGDDADAPTPDISLSPDLPADPDDDDPDPATAHLDEADDEAPARGIVRNVVGVKFNAAGKIYEFDAGEHNYVRGEPVIVETERGTRMGTVAIASVRRPHTRGQVRKVLRRPDDRDRRAEDRNAERGKEALQLARDRVRDRRMDIKMFRAEYSPGGSKLLLYFSSEKRVDFRELARDLGKALHTRIEMRQTGVRDEAKLVGGIGSCGLELCCSTFLPSFAPVSIKMAKDQGLVLNPSKVSGQCGRLKCCLVYEQDMYAAMRKGLPKLGKRVLTEDDREGRVVEVDVLRQRIRVSFGPGDFEIFGAGEVRPMFPPQQQGEGKQRGKKPKADRPEAPSPTDDDQ